MQQYVIFNVLKEYCIPKEEEEIIHQLFQSGSGRMPIGLSLISVVI
jgi:hypothetical protein